MRPLLIGASLATIGVLTFAFGADVLQYVFDTSTDARNRPVASTAVASVPQSDVTVGRPSAEAVRPVVHRPEKVEPVVESAPAPQKVALRRKPRVKAEEPTLTEVTGLKPVSDEEYRPHAVVASADPNRAPRTNKNLSNPMRDRWIDELSGQRAKLSMGKESAGQDCGPQGCERVPAPKDISVAGVVVKTERLQRQPSAPLDGRVKQGNFQDYTPAVYVE